MFENLWSAVWNPTSALGPSGLSLDPYGLAPIWIHHLLLSNLTTAVELATHHLHSARSYAAYIVSYCEKKDSVEYLGGGEDVEDLVLDLLEFLLVGGTLDDELVLLLLQLRLLLGRHDAQQLVLHHARSTTVVTSAFIPGIFFFGGGGGIPPPRNGSQVVCS